MDMLKSKLPPVQRPVDIKNRPKIPIPDEDPYSEAAGSASSSGSSGLGGSGSAGEGGKDVGLTRDQLISPSHQLGIKRSEKPPKLPPRDNIYPHALKPDYDDIENENRVKHISRGKSDKGRDSKQYDDPYYSGLRARVPNFAKANTKSNGTISDKKTSFFGKKESKSKDKEKDLKDKEVVMPKQRPSFAQMPHPASFSTLYQLHQMQNGMLGTVSKRGNFQRHKSQPEPYSMWHAKSYESGIDAELESPYPIYGRLPTPSRGYVPVVPRTKVFVGEWE